MRPANLASRASKSRCTCRRALINRGLPPNSHTRSRKRRRQHSRRSRRGITILTKLRHSHMNRKVASNRNRRNYCTKMSRKPSRQGMMNIIYRNISMIHRVRNLFGLTSLATQRQNLRTNRRRQHSQSSRRSNRPRRTQNRRRMQSRPSHLLQQFLSKHVLRHITSNNYSQRRLT